MILKKKYAHETALVEFPFNVGIFLLNKAWESQMKGLAIKFKKTEFMVGIQSGKQRFNSCIWHIKIKEMHLFLLSGVL